jgi:taurine dioxygenase
VARIVPSGFSLGCRVEGLDVSEPLAEDDFRSVLEALARHGVVCFPGQTLAPDRHKAFAARFGSLEVNVAAGHYTVPGHPEVMVLSNIVENGRAIGLADAGQDWHTDMSYSATIAWLNVLHAIEVPVRDGEPLGSTEFLDMCRAWEDLPADVRRRLEGLTATHDFDKFWREMLKRPGTQRKPLSEEQRRQKPPVSHPIALPHPLSGRTALYCNVGYVTAIDGLPEAESRAMLDMLFRHQVQAKYKFTHRWTAGDVLVWDNLWTMHNAVADYGPGERRHMRRCQVMADWVLGPEARTYALPRAR